MSASHHFKNEGSDQLEQFFEIEMKDMADLLTTKELALFSGYKSPIKHIFLSLQEQKTTFF
jgi:hypothetical protein